MSEQQNTASSSPGLGDIPGLVPRFGAFVDRHEYSILALGLVLFFIRSFMWSQATPMVPDELLTYVQAQVPSPGALWTMLETAPTTLDPPLNPFVSFLALRLPLPFTLALRVPAILCYAAMMLSIFVFVRRRFPPAAALLAFALPMALPVVSFSIQSRPYALWLAASGWALVFWQSTGRDGNESEGRRALPLCGLYLCLTAAILAQYVGGLIFIPLIAGELWRSRKTGRDVPVWLTFIAAGLSAVAYFPFLKAASAYKAHPWHGVDPRDLDDTYLLGISTVAIVVIIVSVAAHMLRKRSIEWGGQEIGFSSSECVALTVLYSIPVMMFVVAVFLTHSYVPRYSIIFSIAAACFMGVLLFALTRQIRGLAAILLTILFLRAALPPRITLHFPQETGGISATLPTLLKKHSDLPIVMPIWDSYLRFYLFGSDELKKRMLLVWDPDRLTELGNNGSLANRAVERATHCPFALAPEFFRTHHDFLLVGNYALRDRLIEEGWTVALIGKAYGWDLYRVTFVAFR
jgi:hypothetical protein